MPEISSAPRKIAVGLGLLVLLVAGGVAGSQVGGEPTVATQTFTHEDVVTYTIPTETVVSTVTETVVSTVTEPGTTTDPPTTTEPEDPPPTQPDIVQSTSWTCSSPQDRGLVRLTMSNGTADAIQFRSGCTGQIDRVEVTGTFADCFKVSPPAPAAHDLEIGGGFCLVTGPPAGGVHQDCIQAGGGENFLIRDFVFDCVGGGGGNYFIAGFNGGTPRNFICDHCAFGPRHPNQIRTSSDPDSGVTNSLVCESLSGRETFAPASGDKGGNTVVPAGDLRCTFAGLMAYTETIGN